MDFLIPKNMTIFEGISQEHYFIKHKPFNFGRVHSVQGHAYYIKGSAKIKRI